MVLYQVYSHEIKKRYKSNIFSKASIVQFICVVLSLLGPFLIAYYMTGFWIKQKQFIEQPNVNFQYRYLALLEDDTNVYVTSSYENVNQIYIDDYRPSIREINELDYNNDGLFDALEFNIFVSNVPSTSIKNIKLLLLFNLTLSAYANLKLESLGYLESYNSKSSSEVSVSGALQFFQSKVLKDKAFYDYSYQLLNQSNVDLEELNIDNIVKDYNSREYATRLVTDHVTWKNTIAEGFSIKAYIRYAPFNISYVPSFWEQFKYGWIQYLAVLIPTLYVFNLVRVFIFENQLVPTIVIDPTQKIKNS